MIGLLSGKSTYLGHESVQLYVHMRMLLEMTAYTVKPVLVATSIKQATCIKQASVQFPWRVTTLKSTCIKQAHVFSKHILIVP